MDKVIAGGPLGNVGAYDLEFKGGRLMFKLDVALPPDENLSLSASIGAAKVFDALTAAIPGKLDDFAIGLIKTALGI